jgi:hypothetical protein
MWLRRLQPWELIMSRGLGRIERWIAEKIEQHRNRRRHGSRFPPSVLVSSSHLAYCYLDEATLCDDKSPWLTTAAQRKAVVRAMHSFVRKFPQYALMGGQGRKELYLYEPADPLSTVWAELHVHNRRGESFSIADAHVELRRRSRG